jgi:hypothetical protein
LESVTLAGEDYTATTGKVNPSRRIMELIIESAADALKCTAAIAKPV